MPRTMIEQTTAIINGEVSKPSPDLPKIAHDALRIIYCCLSKMKLQPHEVEKAVNEMEFIIGLGGGRIRKSLTAEKLFGGKPDACEAPPASSPVSA